MRAHHSVGMASAIVKPPGRARDGRRHSVTAPPRLLSSKHSPRLVGGSRIGLLWGRRSSFGREWADRRRASVHSQIGPTSRTPRSGSLAPAWGVGGWQTHVLHVHVCSASLRAVSEVPTIQSCAFPIQHLSSRRPCDMAKNGTAPFRPTRQEEPGTPSPCRYHAGLNFLLAGRTSQWPVPEATNLWING